MINSKRQLIEVSNEWLNVARNDVRKHMMGFMRHFNMNAEQVADALDADVDLINGIINGTCEIPMSLFAKILIATGHIITIAPVQAMQNMARPMPTPTPRTCGRRPMPQPMRDARGRFASPNVQPRPFAAPLPPMDGPTPMMGGFPRPNPNGQLPTPEELFEQFGMEAEQPMDGDGFVQQENFDAPDAPAEANTEDDAAAIASRLASVLRENPELRNIFKTMMGE